MDGRPMAETFAIFCGNANRALADAVARAAGIEVEAGLMAAEAERINRGFFSRMRRGRPCAQGTARCTGFTPSGCARCACARIASCRLQG
jgi:hypothetical protein